MVSTELTTHLVCTSMFWTRPDLEPIFPGWGAFRWPLLRDFLLSAEVVERSAPLCQGCLHFLLAGLNGETARGAWLWLLAASTCAFSPGFPSVFRQCNFVSLRLSPTRGPQSLYDIRTPV